VGLPNNIEPRLLLVDRYCSKRRLRTTVFRNCEIAIEAVGSVREAVGVLTLQRFDLILMAARPDQMPGICNQLRKLAPRQRIALLVGPPDYLRDMPGEAKAAEQPLASPSANTPNAGDITAQIGR